MREAIVLALDNIPENKRLIAYVVARDSAPLVKELREHLKKKLPEYMVPATFIYLEKIPLTTNGKVDRKALPKPEQNRSDLWNEYVGPRTETERTVCRIWTELLGIERVSIYDNFFELGGHSLMILNAVLTLNEVFKCDLPNAALFENPTVAALSALLEREAQNEAVVKVIDGPDTSCQKCGWNEPSKASLALITATVGRQTNQSSRAKLKLAYRMRESWICAWILAPLYRIPSQRLRSLIQYLILKLEGGDYFTVTLRKLYATYHDLHIGNYTCMCFDVNRMPRRTKVGRYTSIYPTVVIRNADHPRNTISTCALFYHSHFGFAKGYELPRMEVEIGNDVFIGHNVTILYPTRKIGDGAVIAAGSVVTEDVPPYAIVGGYPAKVLRYRFSKEKIESLMKSRWWEATLEELDPIKDQFALPLEGGSIR